LHQLRERGSVAVGGPCDDSRFIGKRLRAGASGRLREVGHRLPIMTAALAGVAESVDASVSNTDECKLVWVRVPPPAPAHFEHERRPFWPLREVRTGVLLG